MPNYTAPGAIARMQGEKWAVFNERQKAHRAAAKQLIELGLGMLAMQNVIYYDHTGRFGFGWREPLSDVELSTVLDIISEFSFPYDNQNG